MNEYFSVPAKDIFDLVTTHGLPLDFVEMLLEDYKFIHNNKECKFTYDKDEYKKLWEEHRLKSKNKKFNKKIF